MRAECRVKMRKALASGDVFCAILGSKAVLRSGFVSSPGEFRGSMRLTVQPTGGRIPTVRRQDGQAFPSAWLVMTYASWAVPLWLKA